jgi:Galactose oxidase, central domain
MSVLSPKRVIQFVVALLLAVPLLANHPSPRIQAKMAFDESTGTGVLFGGRTLEDGATGLAYSIDETWLWVRDQWVQRFPAERPGGRSAHAMVYDSNRQRVLLFGGRAEATQLRGKFTLLNDTWQWKNGNWQQLETGNSPGVREHPDMAYDRARDRVILFGGYRYAADGKTIEPLYDTWEFDGNTWSEVQSAANGPQVDKPLMVYDRARNQTILLGIDKTFKTLMYRWNHESRSWETVTAETMPPCVHEATLAYQEHNQTLVVTGGLCSTETPLGDEVYEWNGSNWTKVIALLDNFAQQRTNGSAYVYDTVQDRFVRFGGTTGFGTIMESATYLLRDTRWTAALTPTRPSPRSLTAFRRDPDRGTIWMYGGLSEFSIPAAISYHSDFWRYRGDQGWLRVQRFGDAGECVTPAAAYDIDRKVMVMVCGGREVWEWNGAEWKSAQPRTSPDFRRFASLVYDQNIKKIVMFGGFDNLNYRDETWTWDGTTWTRLRPNKRPGHRAQMAMWYDTRAKKTILYSGVGRPNLDEHVTRYEDMWSFDGTNWTEMSKTSAPGIRFGSQAAVDPRDGKVLLFGGLRATIDDDDNVDQFYSNDTWLWDGAAGTWTRVNTPSSPTPRQNVALEFDDATGKFILYGGFAGNVYLSDTWLFDGTTWTPVIDKLIDFRRRSVRP